MEKRDRCLIYCCVLCLVFFSSAFAISQESEAPIVFTEVSAFEDGNQAYKDGDFNTAIGLYEQALDVHGPLPEIYYNIGNAYFKQDQKGFALANFLRARRLEPRNHEIIKNIEYLKSLIEYQIDDRTSWYVVQMRKLLAMFTILELSVTAFLGVFILLLLLMIRIFAEGRSRGFMNVMVLIQICVMVIVGSAYFAKRYVAEPGAPAVVLGGGVAVRYGPSNDDKVMMKLVEGLEVYVVDRRTEWSRVILLNKETGWVPNKAIEMV